MSASVRLARLWWILPVGLFIILRLFGASPIFLVKSDQCSYLALAQSFPFHRLYNGQLYLIHPPLWGWIVGVFHLEMPLVTAGLGATQVFALAYLAVMTIYGRINRLGHAGLAAAILFIAIQPLAIGWDSQVSRLPFLVFITTLALVVFERWIGRQKDSPQRTQRGAEEDVKYEISNFKSDPLRPSASSAVKSARFPWLVLLVNTLAVLTSDQCLMLLPCQAIIFAFSGRWQRWKAMLALMALSSVAFLIWPAVRLQVYLTHDTYPAGINGTIEDVRNAPIKAIFQPNLLPNTLAHNNQFTAGELTWANLRWEHWTHLWRVIGSRPFAAGWLAAALVALALLRAVKVRGKNLAIDWPDLAISLKLVIITALLYLPAAAGLYPWYAMAALVPFALLLGRGVDGLRLLLPRVDLPAGWAIAALCVPVAIWWLSSAKPLYLLQPWLDDRQGGRHFLYSRSLMYRAGELAGRINRLPDERGAVMAELSMELTVLTDRRSFDVPFDPAELWPIIERYDVRYIVIDENLRQIGLYQPPAKRRALRTNTYNFIVSDPRFQQVDRVEETYPGLQPPASFRIYRVLGR